MNKPILWMDNEGNYWHENVGHFNIPLYTHPVKEQVETIEYTCPNCQTHVGLHVKHPVKELTDEEIYRLLADSIWAVGLNTDCLDEQNWADGITVAKAILRKAQEK